MATASNRGGGPGTYKSNGVQSTMDAPWKDGLNMGQQKNMSGTFDAPRSGGANGLPTTVVANLGKASVPKAGFAASAPSKDMDGVKTY